MKRNQPLDAKQDPPKEDRSQETSALPTAKEHKISRQIQLPFSADDTQKVPGKERGQHVDVLSIPLAFFAVDLQGALTLFEGIGAGFDHLPLGHLVGLSILEVYPDLPETRIQLANAFSGHAGKITEQVGEQFFQTTLTPLRDGKGKVIGALGVRRALGAGTQTVESIQTGENSEELENRTLALASHELRAPLNSVVGFVNLLLVSKETQFGKQDLFYLKRIQGNATYLLGVIGEMLDSATMKSGRLTLTVSSVDLGELIRDAVDDMRGHPRASVVELKTDVSKDARPIDADRQKLRQVLINLIGNALKYTERGSIVVQLDVDQRHLPTRIQVRDTGVGIPKDKLESIFDPFVRVEQGRGERKEGAGLGLTVSRSLCELMGYTIDVTSELNKGSTFTIHLSPVLPPQHD